MTATATGAPVAAPRPVTPLSILSARLVELQHRVAAIDPDLGAELAMALPLATGLDAYLESCTTPESVALQALSLRTATHDWDDRPAGAVHLEQEMLSGHVEGQLLKLLVHATGAVRVLEIGMFTGYSALAMAEALPADGVVVACELDPAVAAFARESFEASPDGDKIAVRVGPALQTLTDLAAAGETFDLVFIDADKGGYTGYVNALLTGGLLSARALVCVDNTLLQGQPYAGGQSAAGADIAAFNAALASDPRVEQVLLPVRDGITLLRKVG